MSTQVCPECGKPLPTGCRDDMCPSCLFALVVPPAGGSAAQPSRARAESARATPLFGNEKAGNRIGHYKLLEVIGEGGFGMVWMAEQEEPVRRRVALKVLKPGLDTKEVVARFEAERQALAMMDHPNIAKVLDGGATENGRPFFVMELVGGVPITTFYDRRRMSTRERIELFVLVCEAVQHAHQKGIIHRDLKPGNILVSEQDGRFVPKVIDFGVAKALEEPLTGKTLFTRFQQFLGTPEYMSPEQAGLGGLDVDTRSDIYSLGVLLYELLTGKPPFRVREIPHGGRESLFKMIRESDPVRPSTGLTSLSQVELTSLADCRRESPQEISKVLRGELDWIVLKALDKDRGRRYATASALAAELRRFLRGEVVTAAPPTVSYRLQKAWRRHKLLITASTAITASLLIGLAISTWLFLKEQRSASDLRASLYASEMNLAFRAWQDGRVVRTRALLERQNSAAGNNDLRGFEWRYLWNRSRPHELFTMTNASSAWGMALSPDGRTVAACSEERVVLWDTTTRQRISTLDPHAPGWQFSMAFSPDGQALAVAHYQERKVKLWDTRNRKQVGELHMTQPVIGAAYSPDGETLVTTGGWIYARSNYLAEVVLWHASTQQEIRRLRGAISWVYQATFSPDGQTLAASGGDGAVTLWDVATGEMIGRLSGHNGFVEPLTFSHDGKILAVGDEQGYVWLWNWRERRVERVFRAHERPIYTILFARDDQTLITTSRDQTARMWDRTTGREMDRFAGHTGGVTTARLLPGDQTLVTSSQDGNLKFWDLRDRFADNVLGIHGGSHVHLAFTSKGHFLARAERAEERITLFDVNTGANIKVLSGQGIAGSEDGTLLILVRDSKLIFVDPLTLIETGSLDAGGSLGAMAVSPDGKWIAVRQSDSVANKVAVVDAGKRRKVIDFPTSDDLWSPLLFAGGGTLLLTGGSNTISAWDTIHWRKVAAFEGFDWVESRSGASIAASPDGKTVAATGQPGFVLLWHIDRPSNPALVNTGAGHAYSLAFSPDGKTLAVGSLDGTIGFWNVAARQEVAAFTGHVSYVDSLAFAPDGRTLASISLDKTLRLWRAPSFEEISRVEK